MNSRKRFRMESHSVVWHLKCVASCLVCFAFCLIWSSLITFLSLSRAAFNDRQNDITQISLHSSASWTSSDAQLSIKLDDGSTSNCEGKRIYMYDLPPVFNTLILRHCNNITHWLNICPYAQNDGFGQPQQNRSGWFATDPYMLEVIFHARMKKYPCLTSFPANADAFFIPYYTGLDALRYLYGKEMDRRTEHGLHIVEWLETNSEMSWKRRGGHDHFMVLGRTTWDFNRQLDTKDGWGTSFLNIPAMRNVTKLFLERKSWAVNEQAIPYPTSFHPPSVAILEAWLQTVRSSPRPYLSSFVGARRTGQNGSIRQSVLQQCLNSSSSSCIFLDCHKIRCSHNPAPIMDTVLQSEFCFQPPGDTSTRRSTFDGLLGGCIPVFFRNDSAYLQYTWHFKTEPDQYSVLIPQENLQSGQHIEDTLRTYSKERICSMRENIIRMIPGFLYMNSNTSLELGDTKDAFDLSIEGMLNKVRELNEGSSL